MSGYILCQVKRAKNPYYISNISTNIYSIEELCYYLYHNIYLLDETIINEQLLVWMKEELHLRRLYQRLYVLLEEKKNIGEFILPIFKEINYLSLEPFQALIHLTELIVGKIIDLLEDRQDKLTDVLFLLQKDVETLVQSS
jgi:hypothetical protein